MFKNLTEQQINNIKSKFYPQESTPGEFLKKVIVNSYGTDNPDNSLRIVLSVKDGLTNDANNKQIFKIFNNERSKKYMKLKVFQVLNDQMEKEIRNFRNFTDIQSLEEIINKYGAIFRDINPSFDFVGDKANLDAHNLLTEQNNSIELIYDTTFLIPKPNIDYLSLASIFYFDKQEYIKDQNIEERFIDKRILFDKLNIFPLFADNQIKNSALEKVQDLRLVKSSFKDSSLIQNLDINIELNKIDSLIKKSISSNAGDKYFSNAYFSRNSNFFVGLVFSLDYEKLIKNNSTYPFLFMRSAAKNTLLNNCKISSLTIKRRALTKNLIPLHDSTISLVNTGQDTSGSFIKSVEEENGAISEIDYQSNLENITKTYCVTDKNVFHITNNLYQYGVELSISDGTSQFLTTHADMLRQDISGLKQYLEETNKIVKIKEKDLYGYTVDGSYDPQKNSFTPKFINDFNLPRGLEPSYSSIVSGSVTNYINTLNLLGISITNVIDDLKKDKTLEQELNTVSDQEKNILLEQQIIALLNPQNTSAETISYFIKVYERLISHIYNAVKNNYNNSFTVTHWFENEYIDNSIPIQIGYKFINPLEYRGLGVINKNSYNDRANEEINRYSFNQNIDTANYSDKQYSYFSPNEISSSDKMISIRNLNINKDAVSNLDYIELELDIKNINYFSKYEKFTAPSTKSNIQSVKKVAGMKKAENLSKLLFANFTNTNNNIPDWYAVKQADGNNTNENVNVTHLMLALSKQYDLNSKTYLKTVNNSTQVLSRANVAANIPSRTNNKIQKLTSKEIQQIPISTAPAVAAIVASGASNIIVEAADVPIQVNLLLDDKCILLSANEEYKKSLELNSKFQFLFNTLHAVEILEYTNNTFDERWSLVTKQKLQNLSPNKYYICRLRNYKNSSYGISGIDQINLPVYEKYFFLSTN